MKIREDTDMTNEQSNKTPDATETAEAVQRGVHSATPSDVATQTDAPTTEAPEGSDSTDASAGNAEAAKYRRRLRDTEAERDTLAARLTALQRAEAEALAAERLVDGEDLFRYGSTLDDLLGDEGQVDPQKVAAAADALVTERPYLDKMRSTYGADPGQGGGGGYRAPGSGAEWSDMFS